MPLDPDPGACRALQLPMDLTQSPAPRPQPRALQGSSEAAGYPSSLEATASATPAAPLGCEAMACSRPVRSRAWLPAHRGRPGEIASVRVSFSLRHQPPGRRAASSHSSSFRLAPAAPDHRDTDHFAPAFACALTSALDIETPLRGSRRARNDSPPAQEHLRRPRRVLRTHPIRHPETQEMP